MNKLISKIVGACLGLSLATGVGVGIAVGQHDIKEARAETVSDTLNRSTTGITGTNYTNWSGKTGASGAVYAGNSAGGNNSIQLRSSNSNSGIYTTTSGGTLSKVTVVWNSNSTNGRTIDIYGKNSAYSGAANLYNQSSQGTKLGSIVYGSSTELTISGNYTHVGVRSNSGALYLTSITFDWVQSSTPTTYTVTYDGNKNTSGSVPTDSNEYSSGSIVTVLGNDNLTKEDCTFAGWNTDPLGTGTDYSEGDTFSITDNVVLYAKWTASNYSDNTVDKTIKWNLTIASYTSASKESVEWTSPKATMVVNKSGASSDANNYLPPSYNFTRVYANSEMIITPTNNYAISKVTVTAYSDENATSFAGSAFDNASASVSGAIVTLTPTNGKNAISVTLSDKCGILDVFVYYSNPVALSTLSLVDCPSEMDTGETFDLEFNGIDINGNAWTGSVQFLSSDTSVATINGNVLTAVGVGTTNISAKAVGAGVDDSDVVSDSVSLTVKASVTTSDVITIDDTPVTTYSLTSNIQKTGHPAIYASYNTKANATNGGGLQYKSNDNVSGIVSTTSGGRIKSVKITFHANAQMDIYGSNAAYSAPSDLYDSTTQGTKVGSLTSTGTFTFEDDYAFVGIRSNNGARYLTSIEFVWEQNDPTSPKISIDQPGSEFTVGGSGTFTATKTNADDKTISWSSSDSAVISINSSTGEWQTKKVGSAKITAKLSGTAKKSVVNVSVTGTVSIAEAKMLIDALPSGATSEYAVTVFGTVTAVQGDGTKNSDKANQITISDGVNNLLFHFGYQNVENWSTCAVINNVISAKGNLMLYNSAIYEATGVSNLQLRSADNTAIDNFIAIYMHMSDYDPGQDNSQGNNSCLGENGYYMTAKAALTALTAAQIALFQSDDGYNAAQARYEAWAAAYGDSTPYSTEVTSARFMLNIGGSNSAAIPAIVVVIALATVSTGAYFFLRKKKEN